MEHRILFTSFILLSFFFIRSEAKVGAAGNSDPPLPEFLKTYNEVRSCFSLLFGTMKQYSEIRTKYDPIMNLLDNTCKKLEQQKQSWSFASTFFKSVKKVPLGQLPHVANVIAIGSQNLEKLINSPKSNVCVTANDIRNKLKTFDASIKGKVFDKLVKVNKAASGIDSVLAAYKSTYEKYKIIKDRKAEVCPSIVTTFKDLQEWRNNCKSVLGPLEQLVYDLRLSTIRMQNTVRNPVKKLTDAMKSKIEVFPLNTVQNLLLELKKVNIPLPQVRSKARGVGVIPTCCPPHWTNSGGLCYKNCDPGFETVAFTCMRYCNHGYKAVGPLCSRFWWERHSRRVGLITIHYSIPKTHTYARETKARLGHAPVSFGHFACSCRPHGKGSLEGGLCYHKCGQGSFAGFPKSVLDACWETGVKNYKLEQLLKVLNIFEQIKKVPGVGHVMEAANHIINVPMKPIQSVLDTMFNGLKLPILNLKFNINVPVPSILPQYVDKIIAGLSKNPIVKFKRNGLCVDVAL